VTHYGLEVPGIESPWGQEFLHHPHWPRAHLASYAMGTGLFPRVKQLRRGVNQPPPASTKVKEAELGSVYSIKWELSDYTLAR